MKKWAFAVSVGILITFSGCADSASNNAVQSTNTNAVKKQETPTSTPVITGANKPVAAGSSSNIQDTGSTKSANTSTNSAPTVSPTQPPPTTEKTEKKDEGLFSFPPPKVTDVIEIKPASLNIAVGQTTLNQISQTLENGLNGAGYGNGNYKYFWNDNNEFAIVTAMEKVNPNGSNYTENRWVKNSRLPIADDVPSYFHYLISGKKVFYRVFAIIVTPKYKEKRFRDGTPPDFKMALNWKNKGDSQLGGGENTAVENAVFSNLHHCYVLLYLFVNHTRLEEPKALEDLEEDEIELQDEMNKETAAHLNETNLKFGGQ